MDLFTSSRPFLRLFSKLLKSNETYVKELRDDLVNFFITFHFTQNKTVVAFISLKNVLSVMKYYFPLSAVRNTKTYKVKDENKKNIRNSTLTLIYYC